MKTRNTTKPSSQHRSLPVATATALAVAFAASLAQPALAARVVITPPPVPFNLEVPDGNHAFLVGAAIGTQNYVCVPSTTSGTGVAYALFTPEATLFNGDQQIITHFFSPNPDEVNSSPKVVAPGGAIRATWQHSHDSSAVWAKVRPADPNDPNDIGDASTDEKFVAKGAVAWLKLTATGHAFGPDAGDILAKTTFVQRLNTQGGLAPSTGCSSPADLGNQAFMPYTADYFFYTDQ